MHSENSTPQKNEQQNYSIPQQAVFSPQHNQDNDIDLVEIWNILWEGKLIIVIVTILFAIGSVIYALSVPNTYKASALLSPAQSPSSAGGLGALAGQFGGLASMAGINLGGSSEQNKTALALEILKSRAFTESFIEKHNLLVPLMAVEEWDINTNTLIYNGNIYNPVTKEWVREVKFPKTPQPSLWEGFEEFKEHIAISEDSKTGMIIISIEYYSPELAKTWLKLVISSINSYMRAMDNTEAQNSINFLTTKLEQTQLSGMQTIFYQLIEEQTKTMMLTEVSAEYVLKTIDPPNVPDKKNGPKRGIICVVGTGLGGVLSMFFILLRSFLRKESKR